MSRTKSVDLTDMGNAARFSAKRLSELRYVGSWDKWLYWDGKRWLLDEVHRAEYLAQETVSEMFTEFSSEMARAQAALKAAQESEDEDLVELHKDRIKATNASFAWALKCHDAARVMSIPRLAKSIPDLAIDHTQLDTNPWLLNVDNGTLDLQTGELRPHRQEDLITRLCPVSYDPKATCPTWESFLSRAMGGNEELIGFLRRMVGYSLAGVIREHALVFLHGEGANGKSTFVGTLHALLGDYGVRAPRGMLFEAKGNKHETELTTLFGRRFASCAEISKNATWDDGLVKDLTGGDVVTARRMRENHWSFEPTHKLWIAGNHKPRVRGNDEGIWRRIRLVPWSVIVPEAERDTSLPERLRGELQGILTWAVRGCMEWQGDGLGASQLVNEATQSYRAESDPMREFFDLNCVFEKDARISRKMLRYAYEEYCKENGAEPCGAKLFCESLRTRGIGDCKVREMGKPRDGWSGLRLMTDPERAKFMETMPVSSEDAN